MLGTVLLGVCRQELSAVVGDIRTQPRFGWGGFLTQLWDRAGAKYALKIWEELVPQILDHSPALVPGASEIDKPREIDDVAFKTNNIKDKDVLKFV